MADFMKLLQQAKEMQERMQRMKDELKAKSVTGAAGGGMVTVEADGTGAVRRVRIDPSTLAGGDVEMLEDLVIAAVNEAQQRAEQIYEEEMKKVAGGFPLPFNLPNFP